MCYCPLLALIFLAFIFYLLFLQREGLTTGVEFGENVNFTGLNPYGYASVQVPFPAPGKLGPH